MKQSEETNLQHDLTRKREFAVLLWWTPGIVMLIGFAMPAPVNEALWATAFTVAGLGCLANARRCHRVHCYFTGPWYLLIALVSLLYALGIISAEAFNPHIVAAVGIAVGWLLKIGTEQIWGRYWSGELRHGES